MDIAFTIANVLLTHLNVRVVKSSTVFKLISVTKYADSYQASLISSALSMACLIFMTFCALFMVYYRYRMLSTLLNYLLNKNESFKKLLANSYFALAVAALVLGLLNYLSAVPQGLVSSGVFSYLKNVTDLLVSDL